MPPSKTSMRIHKTRSNAMILWRLWSSWRTGHQVWGQDWYRDLHHVLPIWLCQAVNRLAQKVLKRRTDLAWEAFGQFSDNNGAICFTETVVDSGHRFYVCSCIEGVKGSKPCIHVLAMQIENGEREPVDITPMAKSVQKPGEILVNFAANYLI